MVDMGLITRTERRRLRKIFGTAHYGAQQETQVLLLNLSLSSTGSLGIEYNNRMHSRRDIELRVEAHQIMDKLGLEETMRHKLWYEHRVYLLNQHQKFSQKPVQPRQDNKDRLNVSRTSGGRGGLSSVRYPSKKRSKGHWKRFYKLFPGLKPDKPDA